MKRFNSANHHIATQGIAAICFALATVSLLTLTSVAQEKPADEVAQAGKPAGESQTKPSDSTKKDAKKDDKAPTRAGEQAKPVTPSNTVRPTPRGRGTTPGQPPAIPGQPPTGTNPTTPGRPTRSEVPGVPGQPPTNAVPGTPGQPPRGFEFTGGNRSRPGTSFSFDYRNTDIINILRFFSNMSGLTITADPALSGPVTIICNKQVTLDEAFKILQSVLAPRGFTMLQNGEVLSVISFANAKSSATIVSPDTKNAKLDPRNQVMTQVIPLENVDAEAMAKDLTPLITNQASIIGSSGSNSLIITDNATNIKRIMELVQALDKASSNSEMRVYNLKRAVATTVAQTINDIYKQITSRGKGTGTPQPGQPGFQPPQPGQPQGGAAARPAVVAVADSRTNSVLVVASEDNHKQIEQQIISLLDDDLAVMKTEVILVRYANAVDVSNLVNSVLSTQTGAATAQDSNRGSSFSSRAFGGFDPFGFGGGGGGSNQQTINSTDPFGKVQPDPRTNSLFVTATDERMVKIKELIRQVDVDVPTEATTFVVPLKSAQAQDVAFALSQAFNTSQNNNNFGGGFFFGGFGNQNSGRNSQRQPIQRRLGTSTTRSAIPRGRSVPPPPNSPDDAPGDIPNGTSGGSAIPQGIPGVMTPNGFVPTDTNNSAVSGDPDSERTRQFFFGGGRNRQLNTNPLFGRGQGGRFSSLLQLQNNVFVTPSPNGESLIITTTPDNYEALKKIIEELDIVPRQVLVEVIVAEVTLDKDERAGFNIGGMLRRLFSSNININGAINNPANGFNTSTSIDPTLSGSQIVLTGTNSSAILQALSTDTKIKVLSTPRVFTANSQPANISITTNIPYITGQTSSGFVDTTVSNQVEYLPIGLQLDVTPRISRDGGVTMEIVQQSSELIQFDNLNTGTGTLRAPRYSERYADTVVTVQHGQTIVVGGLIRDSHGLVVNKVPLLGDIPILGQFFRSRQKTHNRSELMIFVTPYVVETDKEVDALATKYGGAIINQIPELKRQMKHILPKEGEKKDEMKKEEETKQPAPNPEKK